MEVHAPPLNSFLFAAGALTERVDSLSHGDDLSVRDRNGTAGDGVDRPDAATQRNLDHVDHKRDSG